MSTTAVPRVRISGAPFDRGVQLGQQAKAQIRNSLDLYERTFAHFTGLTWAEVRERALAYKPAIEVYDPDFLEEMAGTAQGAEVDFEDILAINARTEVMYGHSAKALAECTSFGARGTATASGEVIIGQNWDWLPAAAASCILLEAEIPDKPAFITAVEAGLGGKMGFNSAGIGVVTNLLLTEEDCGTPGVPYHVVMRNVLSSASIAEARNAITRGPRASSANYLVASADGEMIDFEARPGGPENVHEIAPSRDLLAHANSFCGPLGAARDRALDSLPDSPARTDRMAELVEQLHGRIDVATASAEITHDHSGHPASICRHTDETVHPLEGIATLCSVLINLTESSIYIAFGSPCENRHEKIVPAFAFASARQEVAT